MKTLTIMFCLMSAVPGSPKSEDVIAWQPVRRVCGTLQSSPKGKMQPLGGASLRLYEWKWRVLCCQSLKRRSETVSSRDGAFDFGQVGSGRYWLVASWQGKEYQMPVDVDHAHDAPEGCSMQGALINNRGIFVWYRSDVQL